MSGTIWPVDAVSGAPSYTGRMLREAALTPLTAGATAARPFGGISGVRPGTAANIGTMSGLGYTVTPFGGLVDGETSNLAGVYGFAFPANETGTINAQTGTARTDLLSVKINDPAEGDSGLPSVTLVYTVGAPTAVSPGHGFDVYKINVPATGGGSPTLTWVAPVTAAAGGRVQTETLSQLTAMSVRAGTYGQVFADGNAANNMTYKYNGSAWKEWESDWIAYTPTFTASSGTFTTISGVSAEYKWVSGAMFLRLSFQTASVGSATGTIFVSLPGSYTVGGDFIGDAYNVSAGVPGPFSATTGATTIGMTKYDGTSFIGTGNFLRAQGLVHI
jgi:hypothetical protein